MTAPSSHFTVFDATAAVGLLAATGLLAGLRYWLEKRFYAHLREHHPDRWAELSSGQFVFQGRKIDRPLHWFIAGRNFRAVNDPRLTRLGNRCILADRLQVFLWVGLLVYVSVRALQ